MERGWPNTPLAGYLDVDFEVVSVNMMLMPPWEPRARSGEVTRRDLEQAMNTQWNVVDEITMIVRKV